MNRRQKGKTQPLCISLPGFHCTIPANPASAPLKATPPTAQTAAESVFSARLASRSDRSSLDFAEAVEERMTPFHRTPPSLEAIAAIRRDLLSQPCELYTNLRGGRRPTEAEKLQLIEDAIRRILEAPLYQNNLYTVQTEDFPPFIHLNIRRNDWAPCKDWRHFQRIKNELVGVENEAIELFPAESRLMDTSNSYHLWVHRDPAFRFPVGLQARVVTSTPFGHECQRKIA